MPLATTNGEPVKITVVESDACHFCADAHKVLAAVAGSYPLEVDTLNVHSEPGRALMARHRAPMSPLILLDGCFFSTGRLPRRKLEKILKARYGYDIGVGAVADQSRHG